MVKNLFNNSFISTTFWLLQSSLQILLFILLPLVIFTTITSKTDLIKGFHSYAVVSGSMEPTLPVGSMIYTRELLGYKPTDIISFKSNNDQIITHRVTDVSYTEQISYITQGDANDVADATPVSSDKVVGKVIIFVPYIGYFTNFLKTPVGFLSFIIFPTILFVGFELWNIKKELEKEVEKRMLKRFLAQQQIS